MFLFQKRDPVTKLWQYCAKRTRPQDHHTLDQVSRSINVKVSADCETEYTEGYV